MFTLHGTAKLLTSLKVKPTTASAPTTRLGNWYVSHVAGPRGQILCMSERTYLPVVVDPCKAAELPRALADGLARLLEDLEVPTPLIEQERFAMMQAGWAKTASASLLGVLNDQRRHVSHLLEDYKPSLPVLNRFAAQNIVKLEFPLALTRIAFGLERSIHVVPRRPDLSRLTPLALESVGDWDPANSFFSEEDEGPHQKWAKEILKRGPRPAFEMEQVFPNGDLHAIHRSIEARDAGFYLVAHAMLEDLLELDVRCLDAHAHLGNLEFDDEPEEALRHYELGVAIGDLSLRAFDGVLPWGLIGNRPYLRCLQGQGLCLWRLRRTKEATEVFTRLLRLNPTDNQGARFVLDELEHGRRWRDDL